MDPREERPAALTPPARAAREELDSGTAVSAVPVLRDRVLYPVKRNRRGHWKFDMIFPCRSNYTSLSEVEAEPRAWAREEIAYEERPATLFRYRDDRGGRSPTWATSSSSTRATPPTTRRRRDGDR